MTINLPDPDSETTISAQRAADVLGISARSVYRCIEAGDMPAIKVGRSVRIPTARFLAAYGFASTSVAA